MSLNMTLTDRTRILTAKRCRRERFLAFHSRGTGIQSSGLVISLSTGVYIHKGVENILKGKSIDESVGIAISEYEEEVSKKHLEVDENEDEVFVYNEQKALIEGLIRVYGLVQYPRLMSEYEVLEVEKEINWELIPNTYKECEKCSFMGMKFVKAGSPICINCNSTGKVSNNDGITIMSRLDAVFKDKSTEGIIVYSLKSASSWTDTNDKQSRYDDQGISELIAYERSNPGVEVDAILMNYLIKGQRSWLKDTVTGYRSKIQNSFIVHPYLKEDPYNVTYSLKYTRAKGYQRVNIWEVMPMKEWIDMLVENDYTYLVGGIDDNQENKGIIVTPAPYIRSTEDIQSWLEQNSWQEQENARAIEILKNIEPELPGYRETQNKDYKLLLNQLFPQNRSSCYSYGRYCNFEKICWEGLTTQSYEYASRIPHHELELVQLKKG
jgi:hypothetical protein